MAVDRTDMAIRLSDEARQYIGTFTTATGATAVDCIIEDHAVVFVVDPDDMAKAIGPGGETVRALERRLGDDVILIEHADEATTFVANALTPAAVYGATIEERDDVSVAIVRVDPDDMGVAIGRNGARIDRARRLAARHVGVEEIELVEATDRS